MKGNDKLIGFLNELLADELTAISQLMVHSEMCANWGYEQLHKKIESQAIEEMHHAEWLIQRILFLEGLPVVTKLNEMKIGRNVLEMLTNDQNAELDAIRSYNEGITLAGNSGDQSTADLLTTILKMEEGHHDWAQKQRTQIEQMGLENYLGLQINP
ncbi:MAG TPA: bacterioferritin [Anaerolineae bacterium]|nr:bacterioferritin [Anaerolineae bacterium]